MKTSRRALCALLLLAAANAAAEDPVSFKLTPPAGKVKLAEPFKIKVEASYPGNYSIKPDTASAGNLEFEAVSFTRLASSAAGGKKTDTFEIKAKAFALGQSTFPAVTWELYAPGAASVEAKTQPFVVEILPAFEKADGDIRDIYPPYSYTRWLLWLALALAAAALIRYLYKRFGIKPGGRSFYGGPWADTRTPYQRARERLERLSASPLPAAGRMKEFYIGLTAILRFYLAEEFAIDAELMTTADLMKHLKRTGTGLDTTLGTRKFLEKADLVKFARLQPPDAAGDAAGLLELLGEFARAAENAKAAAAAAEAAARAKAAGGRP